MFYHVLFALKDQVSAFNVFKYISVRSALAFLISYSFVVWFGKHFIAYLKTINFKEHVELYGHKELEKLNTGKAGTPTMGGLMIAGGLLVSLFFCGRFDNAFIWLSLFVTLWFSVIGFWDDWMKLRTKKGLTRKQKLGLQIVGAGIFGGLLFWTHAIDPTVYLPFLKNASIPLGVAFVGWALLTVISTCNAVNFTDGLDGLAIGSTVMVAITMALLSYITGNAIIAKYLFLPFVNGSGELMVVCSALCGAGLGFLWFNAYPAEVFMGDTGSSLIGALLGAVAVMIHKELLLVIAGGVFVAEAISVILQLSAARFFKTRIFKAAPFHHHLRLSGWSETKVTVRLWIISLLLVIVSLTTLKIQ